MGALSRRKGASYERHIANRLKRLFGEGTKRGLGQARSGNEVPDVQGTPFWLQLKHEKRPNLFAALEQAIRDMSAKDLLNIGLKYRAPIVIARKNGGQDVVVLRLSDFENLLEELLALQKGNVSEQGNPQ